VVGEKRCICLDSRRLQRNCQRRRLVLALHRGCSPEQGQGSRAPADLQAGPVATLPISNSESGHSRIWPERRPSPSGSPSPPRRGQFRPSSHSRRAAGEKEFVVGAAHRTAPDRYDDGWGFQAGGPPARSEQGDRWRGPFAAAAALRSPECRSGPGSRRPQAGISRICRADFTAVGCWPLRSAWMLAAGFR